MLATQITRNKFLKKSKANDEFFLLEGDLNTFL